MQCIEKWCSSIVRIFRVRKHPLHKQSKQLRWRLPTGKAPLLLCQTVGAAAKYLPTYTSCVVSALRDHFSDRWLKLRAFNSVPGPLNTLKLTSLLYIHTLQVLLTGVAAVFCQHSWAQLVWNCPHDSVSVCWEVAAGGCWFLRLFIFIGLNSALSYLTASSCTVIRKHWLHIGHVTVLESFRFEVIGTSADSSMSISGISFKFSHSLQL